MHEFQPTRGTEHHLSGAWLAPWLWSTRPAVLSTYHQPTHTCLHSPVPPVRGMALSAQPALHARSPVLGSDRTLGRAWRAGGGPELARAPLLWPSPPIHQPLALPDSSRVTTTSPSPGGQEMMDVAGVGGGGTSQVASQEHILGRLAPALKEPEPVAYIAGDLEHAPALRCPRVPVTSASPEVTRAHGPQADVGVSQQFLLPVALAFCS